MLTPDQLKQHSFTTVDDGRYSAEEVNRYFGEVIASYNQMYSENGELIRKISILANKVQDYRRDEDNIRNALLNAQRTSEGIIVDAHKKAQDIIADANREMHDIVSGKDGIVTKARDEAEKLTNDAHINAENIVAAAMQQSEEINFTAKTAAAQCEAEAAAKAEKIISDANAEAMDILTYAKQEAEKIKADAEKLRAESEEIKTDAEKLKAESEEIKADAEKLRASAEEDAAQTIQGAKDKVRSMLDEAKAFAEETVKASVVKVPVIEDSLIFEKAPVQATENEAETKEVQPAKASSEPDADLLASESQQPEESNTVDDDAEFDNDFADGKSDELSEEAKDEDEKPFFVDIVDGDFSTVPDSDDDGFDDFSDFMTDDDVFAPPEQDDMQNDIFAAEGLADDDSEEFDIIENRFETEASPAAEENEAHTEDLSSPAPPTEEDSAEAKDEFVVHVNTDDFGEYNENEVFDNFGADDDNLPDEAFADEEGFVSFDDDSEPDSGFTIDFSLFEDEPAESVEEVVEEPPVQEETGKRGRKSRKHRNKK